MLFDSAELYLILEEVIMKTLKMTVDPKQKISKINREIYGHFSEHLGRCIYGGLFVGKDSDIPNVNGMRKDVVEALKELQVPVLRWPGGCFADEYHWKDGIGPKENRKKMINTHWGGVLEDNSFGTHEFMELCRQIGCEPYICGNVGSGTVQEMSEWVEYMTFDGVSPMAELRKQNGREEPWKLKYFAVGNENWGCGGNMRAEYYSDVFRRYAVYCRNYGENKLYKVACGPSGDDYHWTEAMMQNLDKRNTQGLALHFYTRTEKEWNGHHAPATNFPERDYWLIMKNTYFMEELLKKHTAIMDQYDPENDVALIVDEWGTWFKVEEGTNPGFLYQQNTMRDALVAAINLNLFNKNSKRVKMANIAQIVNVLQSVILTEGESMLLTPTYYIFRMMKEHMDTMLVHSYMENDSIDFEGEGIPAVSESVSINDDGKLVMTLANISLEESYRIDAALLDFAAKGVRASILTGGMGDFNTFEEPENVREAEFAGYELSEKGIAVEVPPCSIVRLVIG